MSRFYAKLTPDKKSTMTRTAHRYITVEACGWGSGVKVESFISPDGKDAFRSMATGGSNGFSKDRLIGTVVDGVFERAVFDVPYIP